MQQPTFVLLGGLPGAGKTTVIMRLRVADPHLRSVDPDDVRAVLACALPGVPYRWYRPWVHLVTGIRTLHVIVVGPRHSTDRLVVHDPATRPLRRSLTGRLARLRGWYPVLVMVDVSRADALAGQRQRRRILAPRAFDKHWDRWQEQRPDLTRVALDGGPHGPWRRVLLVDRSEVYPTVRRVLRHS